MSTFAEIARKAAVGLLAVVVLMASCNPATKLTQPSWEHPCEQDWNLKTVCVKPILNGAMTAEVVERQPPLWGLLPKEGAEYIIYHICQPGTYTFTHSLNDYAEDFEVTTETPQTIVKEYDDILGMPGKWNNDFTIKISKASDNGEPQQQTINPNALMKSY